MRFISEAKPVPHSLHKKKDYLMLMLYILWLFWPFDRLSARKRAGQEKRAEAGKQGKYEKTKQGCKFPNKAEEKPLWKLKTPSRCCWATTQT
jgi:hypothetical protein